MFDDVVFVDDDDDATTPTSAFHITSTWYPRKYYTKPFFCLSLNALSTFFLMTFHITHLHYLLSRALSIIISLPIKNLNWMLHCNLGDKNMPFIRQIMIINVKLVVKVIYVIQWIINLGNTNTVKFNRHWPNLTFVFVFTYILKMLWNPVNFYSCSIYNEKELVWTMNLNHV